jgi:NAD(P)-dependent dehydrogenase (short-subunit alcohol dehydrogenase family)
VLAVPTQPDDQRPIGSGFGAHTTAAEVLAGMDLTGRTALVTGGYSGIGLEVVRALHEAGADVLAPARRPEKAADRLRDLERVSVGRLDLADQASVAAYADSISAELDLVILNAGIMACPETRTPEGWELQLATNHLGHFALVARLWPWIADGARVVSVSSLGHHYTAMRWDDPWFEAGYSKWQAYGQSKTANVLFAVQLDRLGRDRGVGSFSVHPGAILTPLGRHLTEADLADVLVNDADGNPIVPEFKSPEAGAATAVWGATSPQLDGLGGLWLEDCEVGPWAAEGGLTATGVKRYAKDPAEAERLWAWSVEQTGLDLGTSS